MRIVCWLAMLVAAGGFQTTNLGAIRARLADPRTMTAAEIGAALDSTREAITGKAFHLVMGRAAIGPDLLFAANGRLQFLRTAANNELMLTEYTGQPARYCEGSPAPGDLVIEYRQAGAGWIVNARHSTPVEMLSPLYSLLSNRVTLTDEGLSEDRSARTFSAPWKPVAYQTTEVIPGGGVTSSFFSGAPPDGVQAIVIDRQTLLPLRTALRVKPPAGANLPAMIPFAGTLEYVPSLAAELRQPDGVNPPDRLPTGMPLRSPIFPGQ